MRITYGIHASPFGWCVLGMNGGKVCALSFIESNSEKAATKYLKESWPAAELVRNDTLTKPLAEKIFASSPTAAHIPLQLEGTEFQKKVWNALRKIPKGKTSSYTDIARKVGSPKAVRAVGTACGKNKIGVLIPCHRVLASSGKLGGYRWGLKRKEKLLAWEAATK